MNISVNRLMETVIQLINIKSHPFKEKALASYLLQKIKALGYPCYVDKSKEKTGSDTGNVIVDMKGKSRQKISFCVHMDTVNIDFPPVYHITEDTIQSTGKTAIGIDNKAGIAILLEVLELYKDQKHLLENMNFIFTTCEEECFYGAKNIESHLLENSLIYVLDSGGDPIGSVVNQGAGQTSFYISIYGRQSHVSDYTGINAIYLASKFISQLQMGAHKDDITLNISKFNSGLTTNVVPSEAKIKGEISWWSTESLQNTIIMLKIRLEKDIISKGGRYTLKYITDSNTFNINRKSKILQFTENAYKKKNLEFSLSTTGGGSDAHAFIDRGFDAVKMKIGMRNVHSNNEKVVISDLVRSVKSVLSIIEHAK
ncbi:MAG: M20/M25/M40 family metallo-hydrolase [Eubacteriales bacterium]